ncbi:MAG: class I SAM-dependent methyltransferase [Longimicrobiales bacterium]
MAAEYDPVAVTSYFDGFAEREWERLEKDVEAEVNLAVHAHYLRRHIEPGWRVLEVGAGAGRFTIELARLGARVVATDVSRVQLELNEEKVRAAGAEGSVEARSVLDVVDMSSLPDASFDAVVCYGGPLSYVMDRRDDAVAECVRVARPGSPLLFSVMSLWGSVHRGLTFVLGVPRAANEAIIASGDITAEALPGHTHQCHAFRGREFRALLEGGGLRILEMSAATCLTTGWSARLGEVRANPERWAELLDMEIAACAEPGCVETGPHIIAVCEKPVGR